ncbi:MAG: phosphate ABC transporter substrate-binding protein PstS family protein [Chloroflexi bacterium]|nr:MAG: phosphate ABC transporter substrate-binding protein PstS family protein [Chloroflexota bacterium]MBL1193762.1 phosphate ABC transporter substrate-binding protein PstS family protein [Chloroflexota bacterium]NOH11055.1 phosphate ABC transporter substrate-binding protein PstS family protein [Chloroflexota bacterium]
MQRKSIWLFSVLALVALVLAACGGAATTEAPALDSNDPPASEPTEAPEEPMVEGPEIILDEVNPLEYDGEIVIAGSSTLFPLAERMLERWEDEGGPASTYDSIGSGGGFERFCVAGESDISGASRAIKDSEVESCREIGREPIEFRIGTDALAVTVSAENNFVDNLSLEELALVFGAASTWADVNPDWPAEPIQRFIPGTDSGTFDFFVEEVYDEDETEILSASDTQLSEDDNVLVQGIQGSPYAVGFFGYAYYQENADTLKILSIEGVEASAANVDNGSYPIARPLFMYSDASILQSKPQVFGFLSFVLQFVNEEVVDVGYFPASNDALLGAQESLLEATE